MSKGHGLVMFSIGIALVRFGAVAAASSNARVIHQILGNSSRQSSTVDQGAAKKQPRKKSPIYTKTGDKGTSSLYNGERRTKSDLTFDALGNQDELNAVLGITREYCTMTNNGLEHMIIEIQSRLFDVGAAIATPQQNSSEEKKRYVEFPHLFTSHLEEWIDELDASLPPLTNFVLPSGGMSSTHLNLARTVCRRTERSVVPLILNEQVDSEVGIYLNRLSDYLFVASRFAAAKEGQQEIIWRKAAPISPK